MALFVRGSDEQCRNLDPVHLVRRQNEIRQPRITAQIDTYYNNQVMAIPRDLTPYGVYQIGEVYARSWTVILTDSGISMPKRLAS